MHLMTAVARQLAHSNLRINESAPLPDGWSGKLWALEQAWRPRIPLRLELATASIHELTSPRRSHRPRRCRCRVACPWRACPRRNDDTADNRRFGMTHRAAALVDAGKHWRNRDALAFGHSLHGGRFRSPCRRLRAPSRAAPKPPRRADYRVQP